jgi:hypothetical protein
MERPVTSSESYSIEMAGPRRVLEEGKLLKGNEGRGSGEWSWKTTQDRRKKPVGLRLL